jgi:hypothetical protein
MHKFICCSAAGNNICFETIQCPVPIDRGLWLNQLWFINALQSYVPTRKSEESSYTQSLPCVRKPFNKIPNFVFNVLFVY